jgi:hypothetical protein
MKALYGLVTVLAVSVALVACGGGASKPASSAPAAGAPAAAAAAGEPATGVAECDEYIKKYEACLNSIGSKAPDAARAAMKQGFDAQRASFKQAASTDAGKAALAGSCKTALDTAKQATQAYGCSW